MTGAEVPAAAAATEGAKGAGTLAAGEGLLGTGAADAVFADALLGPTAFDAIGGASLGVVPAASSVAPVFDLVGAEALASALPFGLTTSDLLQGGLRAGQYLMENQAYSDAAERTASLQRQMRADQRGYTDRALRTVDEIAALYDPQQFNADYGAEADKTEKTLTGAVMSAAADKPRVQGAGDMSDRYANVSAQTGAAESARIARIADLLGNLGATRNLAHRRGIRTVPHSVELGNVGSDRRAARNLGIEALMGVEPSGGQLMAAQLLGAGADAVNARTRARRPASSGGSIFGD